MRITCALIFGMCLSYAVYAQDINAASQCVHGRKVLSQSMAKTTVAAIEEEQYDIKYVKFDISLTNESTAISGSVVTQAIVTAPILTEYVFELTDTLTIDSVKIFNQVRPVSHNGYVHKVSLGTPITTGNTFNVEVFYHGVAKTGNAFGNAGLNNDTARGNKYTFSISEPYNAREWWPCKQSLQDKIDSADIWITIPEGLKAGSNGLLQSITPFPGNTTRYHWKTNYPIAYYLLSVAVGPYSEYSFYTHLSTGDSVLIQNYIYNDPKFFIENKAAMDSLGTMLQFLSGLFGDYPFKDEKYGHCMAPYFGGMEHQTMSTQIDFNSNLTIHEMGHQWFGDYVTCATWKDIWLNEGFASYIEYLYKENFRTKAEAVDHMVVFHDRALKAPFATIYVDDTTNPQRIFDGGLSYSKAAAVVHMLRFVINDDALFFELLRAYLQQFGNSNTTTEGFKLLAEQKTGLDLSAFFNQWIYKQGHPIYSATWNQVLDQVFIKINQEGAAPLSQNVFETPIELKLLSPYGDSMARITITKASQAFKFIWNKPMTGFSIDPDNWVLNDTKLIERDNELGLNDLSSNSIIVFPNATRDRWHIIGLKMNYDMVLTDMNGKPLWQGGNGNLTGMTIPYISQETGTYILRLFLGKETIQTFKLVKR